MFRIGQQVVASGFLVSSSDGRLPRGIGIVVGPDGNGMIYVDWGRGSILVYPEEIKVAPQNPLGDYNLPTRNLA